MVKSQRRTAKAKSQRQKEKRTAKGRRPKAKKPQANGERQKAEGERHLDLDGGITQELDAVPGLEGALRDGAHAGGAAFPDCHDTTLASRVPLRRLQIERPEK